MSDWGEPPPMAAWKLDISICTSYLSRQIILHHLMQARQGLMYGTLSDSELSHTLYTFQCVAIVHRSGHVVP